MQITEYTEEEKESDKKKKTSFREIFWGKNDSEIQKKMDKRLEQLKKEGHKLVKRIKLANNYPCFCGSGKKLKDCCRDKVVVRSQ